MKICVFQSSVVRLSFFISFVLALVSCQESDYWLTDEAWYQEDNDINVKVNDNFVDVFYLASTEVISSFDENGNEVYRAILDDKEIKYIKAEYKYVRKNIFNDSVNFFAPYYHQFTMNSIYLSKSKRDSIYNIVANEICEAFDYYMEHKNNGRRFVLAGFSQGAMLLKDILRHMTDEQYSRLVVVYLLGEGISQQDISSSFNRIIPAQSSMDKGVCVSFNSVKTLNGIWDVVYNNSVCCINPINWSIDETPADLMYYDSLVVHQDTLRHVLLVDGFDEEKYPQLPFKEPWPRDCLHHYDLLFYDQHISQNVKDRAYR